MMRVRKAEDRGYTGLGWLDSHHTFSFGGYFDSNEMGWGPLRVINDDAVAARSGFPTHSHRDMEIISYVLNGALEHKDTMGTGSVIHRGDVQLMAAGTGVAHSEHNASNFEPVHFLQIWIEPEGIGLRPSYQQRHFDDQEKRGRFRLLVSREGRDESLRIHQDMAMYGALVDGQEAIERDIDASRLAYVYVSRGRIKVNGIGLAAGDGARIADESKLRFEAGKDAEVLLFDLPPT